MAGVTAHILGFKHCILLLVTYLLTIRIRKYLPKLMDVGSKLVGFLVAGGCKVINSTFC